MRKLLTLLILLTFSSPTYATTAYKWVDQKGVVNFTDNYTNVPAEYRDWVETEILEDTPTVRALVPSQAFPRDKEEATADIYGLDENWWKGRVRPWKERLKEATENYERTHKRFIESAEELSQKRYGSRTQYKMNIIKLDRLKEEKLKYEAQIAEAREILEKISREAKESKANPEWVN